MKDKLLTAAEAAALIEDGMHLGVGAGMTMNPMPVVREIIKKGIRGLTLTPVLTGGYVADRRRLRGNGPVSADRPGRIRSGPQFPQKG
jgi:acyl CoA:acetate/3-ketoacid CoA transferase alpha subunit